MKFRGFTLFELLASASLFSVIAGAGFPSLYATMQVKRVQTASMYITRALMETRAAAIEKHHRTIMCPSIDGVNCTLDGQWEQGILMFVDTNSDYQRSTDETLVNYLPALEIGVSIRLADGQQSLGYLPKGSLKTSASFNLCIDQNNKAGRSIAVTLAGRPRTDKHAISCEHHST